MRRRQPTGRQVKRRTKLYRYTGIKCANTDVYGNYNLLCYTLLPIYYIPERRRQYYYIVQGERYDRVIYMLIRLLHVCPYLPCLRKTGFFFFCEFADQTLFAYKLPARLWLYTCWDIIYWRDNMTRAALSGLGDIRRTRYTHNRHSRQYNNILVIWCVISTRYVHPFRNECARFRRNPKNELQIIRYRECVSTVCTHAHTHTYLYYRTS